jgi:hypothetical protein
MRAVPLLVLAAAIVGMATFSQGLRLIDTIGVLVSGAAAGAALASLAARRRR